MDLPRSVPAIQYSPQFLAFALFKATFIWFVSAGEVTDANFKPYDSHICQASKKFRFSLKAIYFVPEFIAREILALVLQLELGEISVLFLYEEPQVAIESTTATKKQTSLRSILTILIVI